MHKIIQLYDKNDYFTDLVFDILAIGYHAAFLLFTQHLLSFDQKSHQFIYIYIYKLIFLL